MDVLSMVEIRDEVAGIEGKLHSGKLHNFYSSLNTRLIQ
jgi:hypothetical protein